MQKKRLYIIVLLIIFPLISALEQEKIYSGTFEKGQLVNISNRTFTLYSINSAKAVLNLPDNTGVILTNGSCETKDDYNICCTKIEFSYHNATHDVDVYTASIDIYEFLPEKAELEVVKEISKTELLIGEETRINLNIKNIGGIQATDITYSDSIPGSFAIMDISGCVIEVSDGKSSIKWHGKLNADAEKKCVYTLRPLDKTSFDSMASANYHNGYELVVNYSNSTTINVSDYKLSMDLTIDKNSIIQDEIANLDITLTNTHNDSAISITSFKVKIPTGLKVAEVPSQLIQNYKEYIWSGKLKAQKTKSFNLKLKGHYVGSYTIKPAVTSLIDGLRREFDKAIDLDVYGDKLSINTRINEAVLSSETSSVLIDIENPSNESSFWNTELKVESTLPNITTTRDLGSFKPLDSIKIDDLSFTAPEIYIKKNYSVNITFSYESNYGQIFTEKEEKIVTVIGIGVEEEEAEEEGITEEIEEEIIEEVQEVEAEMEEQTEIEEAASEDVPEEDIETVVLEDKKPKDYKKIIWILLIPIELFLIFIVIKALINFKSEE